MTYSTSALREQSSAIITRDDVAAVDKTLIGLVEAERTRRDVIVDSHPVTKESFGFRVTPFTAEQIVALRPNAIVCLYASPDTLRTRIARNADGRPLPTDFELAMHVQTQVSVATQYSVLTGASCYLVDSAEEIPELIERVTPIFKFGSPPAPQSASVQKPVT
jgi:adenylate kinase